MRASIYVHVFQSDKAAQGHRLGVVDFHATDFDVAIFFMGADPRAQLAQLRDECQRQIDALSPVDTPIELSPREVVEVVGAAEVIHTTAGRMPPRCQEKHEQLGQCDQPAGHEGLHFWENTPF